MVRVRQTTTWPNHLDAAELHQAMFFGYGQTASGHVLWVWLNCIRPCCLGMAELHQAMLFGYG